MGPVPAPSIFPIIRAGVLGDLQEVCGTGFFVTPAGDFMTCAHLFEDYPNATYCMAPDPLNLRRLETIELTAVGESNDVALGSVRVSGAGVPHLTLADGLPPSGEWLQIAGFRGGTFRRKTGEHISEQVALEVVRSQLLLNVNTLSIPEQVTTRISSKHYPVLVSRPTAYSGFSGAPVLDEHRKVVALHSCTNCDQNVTQGGDPVAVNARGDVLWQLKDLIP